MEGRSTEEEEIGPKPNTHTRLAGTGQQAWGQETRQGFPKQSPQHWT